MLEAKLQSLRTCRGQNAQGRGRDRGQHVEAEVEAEDKISASRTVWPRELNITVKFITRHELMYNVLGKLNKYLVIIIGRKNFGFGFGAKSE